jgi:hypothetical protein
MLYRLIFSYSVDRSIPRMHAAFLMLPPVHRSVAVISRFSASANVIPRRTGTTGRLSSPSKIELASFLIDDKFGEASQSYDVSLACSLVKQHSLSRAAVQSIARCIKRIPGRVEIAS